MTTQSDINSINDQIVQQIARVARFQYDRQYLRVIYKNFDALVEAIPVIRSMKHLVASLFEGGNDATRITIPEGVTKIGQKAFYYKSPHYLTLHDNITSIGNAAFEHCINLYSFDFPANLKTIGARAFYECERMSTIVLPEGLTTIGAYAFYKAERCTTVSLPSTLQSIGDMPFYLLPRSATVTVNMTKAAFKTALNGGSLCGEKRDVICLDGTDKF